jgi:glycosyltransferase involved in cell wall biosynthesis
MRWTGDWPGVIQVTQHLRQRDPYTNWGFWEQATQGLERRALGPGSEVIGGTGSLSYVEMQEYLQQARVYLYTGTQPASYTLGLIEAMMTGIPVVSIGPKWMNVFPYGPDMFEGHELASQAFDDPQAARAVLADWLDGAVSDGLDEVSYAIREYAITLFGKDTIAAQWAEYLK